jgi:hypothetical protein
LRQGKRTLIAEEVVWGGAGRRALNVFARKITRLITLMASDAITKKITLD